MEREALIGHRSRECARELYFNRDRYYLDVITGGSALCRLQLRQLQRRTRLSMELPIPLLRYRVQVILRPVETRLRWRGCVPRDPNCVVVVDASQRRIFWPRRIQRVVRRSRESVLAHGNSKGDGDISVAAGVPGPNRDELCRRAG